MNYLMQVRRVVQRVVVVEQVSHQIVTSDDLIDASIDAVLAANREDVWVNKDTAILEQIVTGQPVAMQVILNVGGEGRPLPDFEYQEA